MQSGYDSEASDVSGDEKEVDSGVISDRLRTERLDAQGKYFRHLSESVGGLETDEIDKRSMSGHQVRQFCPIYSLYHASVMF